MTRPRMRAGANSLMYVLATGSSAPRPRPTKNRSTSSTASPLTAALAPVATPYTSSVIAKTERLPNRSASRPPTLAPIAMPANPAEAIHDACEVSSDHSAISAVMMNEISPTSMASSAQPSPEPVSTLRCRRPKGRASRRRATDGVAVSVMGPCY